MINKKKNAFSDVLAGGLVRVLPGYGIPDVLCLAWTWCELVAMDVSGIGRARHPGISRLFLQPGPLDFFGYLCIRRQVANFFITKSRKTKSLCQVCCAPSAQQRWRHGFEAFSSRCVHPARPGWWPWLGQKMRDHISNRVRRCDKERSNSRIEFELGRLSG